MFRLVVKSAYDDSVLKEIGRFNTRNEAEARKAKIFWDTVKEYGLEAYTEIEEANK